MSELEDALNELQLHNQQLQTVMMQKQSLMIQDKEMEKALEEIEKSGGEEIFKSIGPILVKTSKEAIKKDLEEGREEKADELLDNVDEIVSNIIPPRRGTDWSKVRSEQWKQRMKRKADRRL